MIPQDAVDKAARAIEEGLARDDSVWDLAQEALQAGFGDISRELQSLRHADIDARVNRDIVIRLQDQMDAIEYYIRPENWYNNTPPPHLQRIRKIIDGEEEAPRAHMMVNLRWDGAGHTWTADCSCGAFSSGPVDYAGNAVSLVRKHVRNRGAK